MSSNNIFQDPSFLTLILVLGLYLIQLYSWLWKKLKVMEIKRAEKRKRDAEEAKKKAVSSNITPDDATKLMALLKMMEDKKKADETPIES